MQVGDRAEVTRSYTEADLTEFADLAGAAPGPHVPEPLIAALFSYLLGVRLPGSGTNYLKQELDFRAPAPLNTDLAATVEVMKVRPD